MRIKRLAGQRDDLQDTVRRLKLDLEEERSRASLARGAADREEMERWEEPIIGWESKIIVAGKPRN